MLESCWLPGSKWFATSCPEGWGAPKTQRREIWQMTFLAAAALTWGHLNVRSVNECVFNFSLCTYVVCPPVRLLYCKVQESLLIKIIKLTSIHQDEQYVWEKISTLVLSASSSYFSRLGKFSSFDLISGSVIESRCSVFCLTDSKGPFPLLLPCWKLYLSWKQMYKPQTLKGPSLDIKNGLFCPNFCSAVVHTYLCILQSFIISLCHSRRLL